MTANYTKDSFNSQYLVCPFQAAVVTWWCNMAEDEAKSVAILDINSWVEGNKNAMIPIFP